MPNYLFSDIEKKTNEIKKKDPSADFINLGIGDISFPLSNSIVSAICDATQEMGKTPIGYGPSEGYLFLRKTIVENEYANLEISPDEIFISSGSKNDAANIQEIFSPKCRIGVCDPTYPVYVDANVMAGRTGIYTKGLYKDLIYLPCLEKNKFTPSLPSSSCEIIYLCSPNNPTGSAFTKNELKQWVDYAIENDTIIIYDTAYEAFITEDEIPHSIYEIEGAKKVAIELKSFSKTAGFTGLRCSCMVIPHILHKKIGNEKIPINQLWKRRIDSKFGGVPYPIQKGAEAVYSEEGKKQIDSILQKYKSNALFIYQELKKKNLTVYGGINSPYIWVKTPKEKTSWEFFNDLLEKSNIISIPGQGFGPSGEGYIRLSAFNKKEKIETAIKRIEKAL